MKSEKYDRRVRYTKMVLKEALLKIMKEKSIAQITPTELCRVADINRNTFYAHYMSPIDLLSEIEEELYDEIMSYVTLYSENEFRLSDLCKAIKDHANLCKVILSEHGDRDFLLKIITSVCEIAVNDLKKRVNNISRETIRKYFIFCANGSVAIIHEWVNDGMKTSYEEIASILEGATNAVMKFLITTDNKN